jgi:hypothetical protein
VKGDHTFVIFEKAIAVLLFAMKKGDHSLVVFENAIAILLSLKMQSRFCSL